MKATCPSCNAHLNIDDKKIPAGGARIKCPTCQNIFPVKPGAPSAAGAVPLPGAAGAPPRSSSSGAVPLPGITSAPSQPQDWEEEPTRAQSIALPPEAVPGATTPNAPPSNVHEASTRKSPAYRPSSGAGAVPLPGITASAPAAESWEDESTRVNTLPVPNAAFQGAPPPPKAAAHVDFGSFEPTMAGAVPLPGASAAAHPGGGHGAVPLPGGAAPKARSSAQLNAVSAAPMSNSYEPTHMGKVPLPGGGAAAAPARGGAGAVPLPGQATHLMPAARPSGGVGAPGRGGIVPLPGGGDYAATQVGAAYADGAPMSAGSDYVPTHVGSAPGGGIPLPGGSDYAPTHVGPPARGGGVPLPGGSDYAPTHVGPPARGGGVPLPGGSKPSISAVPPSRVPGDANYAPTQVAKAGGAVPLPGQGYGAPTRVEEAYQPHSDAVPLPGQGGASYEDDLSFDPTAEPTTGSSAALGDVPEAASMDFAEVPAGAFDLPPPAPPPPGPPPSGGFDFSDLPAPPPGAGTQLEASGGFELDGPGVYNLPSPAGSPYDLAPSPAEAPLPVPASKQSTGFGDVDLGGDSLEFDPTSKPPSSGGGDDLEADLSAPLISTKPAGPADGLEMLSFIDDTAKEVGAKPQAAQRRFHIKRRSGKIFGPFEEAVVVKMLEDGQLLGNEEVSGDTESWHPIGAEPAFQGAIAKLMEQPARAATAGVQGGMAQPGVSVPGNRPPPPSMERLKQLYEGRMAAVAVVQGKDPVPLSKRLPLIIAGVLAAAIVVTGGLSATTKYGAFGLKVLFPAKVSANSEEFRTLNEARKSLYTDTFKGYQTTKELTEKLLRAKAYPEVRAVWIQSVLYLSRRYGGVPATELQTAATEQENITLIGDKHIEVVKARANAALADKKPDEALALVMGARARSENEADLELLFLKAEALAAKGQVPQAIADLKAVLEKDKTSARALHALGVLHAKQNEFDLAAGRFGEALAANPEHVSSAVELASIELLERKAPDKAEKHLAEALAEGVGTNLSPGERGRALALKAEMFHRVRKLDESFETFEEALKVDPGNTFAKGTYGALLVERHDYAKALKMLKEASDKESKNLPYVEAYLNALIGLGKMEEATKVMTAASGRFPGNARIAFLSGRVEDASDRTKQAEESYKRAISADPKMIEANIALGSLYLRLHKMAEAKPLFEDAAAKAPDNALVHVGLGELALAESKPDTAQEELRKAVELNPNLPDAFLGLSRAALAKGKADIAEQQAQKALKLDPKIHDGRLQYGTALWKLGRLDAAIKELEQAKEDDPRSVNIPIMLGAVQLDKGDLASATSNLLGNALQKEPGNADANYYMARVKRKRSEYTQAIEMMKKAIDHAARRPEFHYELGNIYQDARKTNEAIDEWKAALAIDSKYADALEALGRSAAERNRHKDAIDYFEKALDADPQRTRLHASIADSWGALTQWQKAIDAYLRALAAEPGLKAVYVRLANAYQEKRKLTEAITWYRKATQADPNDAQAWYNLGYALKEKKDKAEAAKAFSKFLELNTDKKLEKEIKDVLYDMGER